MSVSWYTLKVFKMISNDTFNFVKTISSLPFLCTLLRFYKKMYCYKMENSESLQKIRILKSHEFLKRCIHLHNVQFKHSVHCKYMKCLRYDIFRPH